MKAEDQYLRFVRWSDADAVYVVFCPDLFPAGGVCHAAPEEEAYAELCELVREEVAELSRSQGAAAGCLDSTDARRYPLD